MVIFKVEDNPDGLDPVFAAHKTLKRIFDAAEPIDVEISDEYTETMLRLPGSGEMVDPNDLNALNGLEYFLTKQIIKGLPEKDRE
jgi:hypothetical protein